MYVADSAAKPTKGFVPLEVFPSLWDPWNPALQLVKAIDAR